MLGFVGEKVYPLGTIELEVVASVWSLCSTVKINFLVMDPNVTSAYNIILGRVGMKHLKAAHSTYHQAMKFPTDYGVGVVRGDQAMARSCYFATTKEGKAKQKGGETLQIDTLDPRDEGKLKLGEAAEDVEVITLEVVNRVERVTKIGTSLTPEIRAELIQFLKEHKIVFAWSHEDMPGIDPEVFCHRLHVDPSVKEVKQKR